jgi:hypothetical protein
VGLKSFAYSAFSNNLAAGSAASLISFDISERLLPSRQFQRLAMHNHVGTNVFRVHHIISTISFTLVLILGTVASLKHKKQFSTMNDNSVPLLICSR